jgi:predicted nucleotidyltransferase
MTTDRIADLCRRYGVRRLWILAEHPPHDDCPAHEHLDVLIDAGDVNMLRLGGLQMDLTDLAGRFVHVITLGGLDPQRQTELLREARLTYAA